MIAWHRKVNRAAKIIHQNVWLGVELLEAEETEFRAEIATSDMGYILKQQNGKYKMIHKNITTLYERLDDGR